MDGILLTGIVGVLIELIFGNNDVPIAVPLLSNGVDVMLFGKTNGVIDGNVGWNNGTWLFCTGVVIEVMGKFGVIGVVFEDGSIKSELGVVDGRIEGPFGLVKTFLIK